MSRPLAGVCVPDFSTLLPVPVDAAFRSEAARGYPALSLVKHGSVQGKVVLTTD